MNNYGKTYGALLVTLGKHKIPANFRNSIQSSLLAIICEFVLTRSSIEHRFYGTSQPFPGDLSTKNLNYLTSQQALADAATFIAWIQQQYNATNSPVITFGCSYPGKQKLFDR